MAADANAFTDTQRQLYDHCVMQNPAETFADAKATPTATLGGRGSRDVMPGMRTSDRYIDKSRGPFGAPRSCKQDAQMQDASVRWKVTLADANVVQLDAARCLHACSLTWLIRQQFLAASVSGSMHACARAAATHASLWHREASAPGYVLACSMDAMTERLFAASSVSGDFCKTNVPWLAGPC